MITVRRELLRRLEEKITALEQKGMEAENAAARLNQALGDLLSVAAERSRLAHEAHRLLREMSDEGERAAGHGQP
jgi:hypothetical protein